MAAGATAVWSRVSAARRGRKSIETDCPPTEGRWVGAAYGRRSDRSLVARQRGQARAQVSRDRLPTDRRAVGGRGRWPQERPQSVRASARTGAGAISPRQTVHRPKGGGWARPLAAGVTIVVTLAAARRAN